MMTKDEERALLAKIEKLLSSADPDGYIATAFKGAAENAHRNIDEDAAYSDAYNAEYFRAAAENFSQTADEYKEAYTLKQKRVEELTKERDALDDALSLATPLIIEAKKARESAFAMLDEGAPVDELGAAAKSMKEAQKVIGAVIAARDYPRS